MELHGRRVSSRAHLVVPGTQIDRQMYRGGKALAPLLAQEVLVGRTEELILRQRAEQSTEGTRQQQRPSPGIEPLARHVDDDDLESGVALGLG